MKKNLGLCVLQSTEDQSAVY